jgi:hypothetical protein
MKKTVRGSFAGLLAILWAVSLSGCLTMSKNPRPSGHVDIQVLYRSVRCSPESRSDGAVWIDDLQTLSRCTGESDTTLADSEALKSGPVDFSRDRVMLIFMGQKPSGGYSLDLMETQASLFDETLVIETQWRQPAKGAVAIQMITQPCLVLMMPRGDYQQVRVVDQAGDTRLLLPVPSAGAAVSQ